ncbi:MAG: DUF4373 domain-containing protein [Peptostreptococcaceae bacterium]|nr:DUF4373 domain-containing protein [Peptostreptococcaceae bacterium]MDY5738670.1 DUF4373 domain-containing protein [Anaerovoracaceae bacterium]
MARTNKVGINYFPVDVNFLHDIKFRRLLKQYGATSIAVIMCLYSTIYREEGYYMPWDDNVCFLIADEIGASEDVVNEIVKLALTVNLFDKKIYDNFKILTSQGIQKRYIEACSRRKNVQLKTEYDLLNCQINVCNNAKNVDINNENVCNNAKNVDRSTQRKGKEKKGEEKKGEREEIETPSPHSPTLIPFGEFKNVFLTDTQYQKIQETYCNSQKLIDKISTYLANADKTYRNHFALIKKIANEDNWAKERPKPKAEEVEVKKRAPMPEELKAKMERLFKGDN